MKEVILPYRLKEVEELCKLGLSDIQISKLIFVKPLSVQRYRYRILSRKEIVNNE